MRLNFHSRNFGVLEIIVSVAIFAAFSVFVLKLFVAGETSDKRMGELDRATMSAVSIVERFKGSGAPFEVCSSLGASAPESGSFSGTVGVSDSLNADVKIGRESSNAAGSLYRISVNVRDTRGQSVYDLSDLKFFRE